MTFHEDIENTLKINGMNRRDLAKVAGISYVPLCQFLNHKTKGTSIAERLIPFIYGDKRAQLSKNAGAKNAR